MERQRSIFYSIRGRSNGFSSGTDIHRTVLGSEYLIKRLKCEQLFVGHQGCVNTVAWNESGDMLLSGSDDCKLNLYRLSSMKPIQSVQSGHRANIFSAKFLPCGDTKIVSCSGDGVVHYNDVNSSLHGKNPFRCHSGTTYEVNTTPGDPHSFLSSGEDGTVRLFDLRYKTKCLCEGCKDDVLIDCGNKAVTSFSVNPLYPYYIAVGCEDSTLRIYDRRSLSTDKESNEKGNGLLYRFKPKSLGQRNCRVTSLNYSSDGHNLLASFCTDYVYLFDANPKSPTQLHSGNPTTTNDTDGLWPHADSDPPLKRLRLRGDWSDTGPNARPESEDSSSGDSTFIQRMSGYLTRWIQESMQNTTRHSDNNNEEDNENNSTESTSIHEEGMEPTDEFREGTEESIDDGQGTGDSIDDGLQVDENDNVFEDQEETTPEDRGRSIEDHQGTLEGEREDSSGREDSSVVPMESPMALAKENQRTSEDLEGFLGDHDGPGEAQRSSRDQECSLLHQKGSSKDQEGSLEDEEGSLEDLEGSSEDEEDSEGTSAKNPSIECEACSTDAGYKNGGKTWSAIHGKDNVAFGDHSESVASRKTDNKTNNSDALARYRLRKRNSKSGLKKCKVKDARSGDDVPALSNSIGDESDRGIARDNEEGMRRTCEDRESNEPAAGNPSVQTIDSGSDVTEQNERTQSSGSLGGEHDELQSGAQSLQSRTRVSDREDSASGSRRANVGESSEDDEEDTRRNAAANIIQNFFRFRHKNSLTSSQYAVPMFSKAKQVYKGHRNARTMIKEANFWGDNYVLSGSDCGRIFIWSRHTGELVTLLEGDRHVVNCVQPHPFDPILATSGIDYDIKLWTPTTLNLTTMGDAHEVIARNEKMLRESRDTLTVPASFMIRVLSSLHRVRVHTVGNNQSPAGSDDDDDE